MYVCMFNRKNSNILFFSCGIFMRFQVLEHYKQSFPVILCPNFMHFSFSNGKNDVEKLFTTKWNKKIEVINEKQYACICTNEFIVLEWWVRCVCMRDCICIHTLVGMGVFVIWWDRNVQTNERTNEWRKRNDELKIIYRAHFSGTIVVQNILFHDIIYTQIVCVPLWAVC